MVHSFRQLIVWQRAVDFSVAVYKVTEKFPREDIYGIVSQMRRAAISIPSNIAEGRHRGTRKDFHHFLHIAYGSGAEIETQIEIAYLLNKMNSDDYEELMPKLEEIMKILNVMLKKLSHEEARS